eukprot:gene8368-biopygen2114
MTVTCPGAPVATPGHPAEPGGRGGGGHPAEPGAVGGTAVLRPAVSPSRCSAPPIPDLGSGSRRAPVVASCAAMLCPSGSF